MPQFLFRCCAAILLTSSFTAPAQDNNKTDTAVKRHKLKEVTISAQKSAIETAPGKTIVNVQAQAGNAGKTLLDVLRKTPGVTVDGMGNVSITGRQGVLFTVNGRQTYLSGDELKEYLQGITAEEVAQIEVISQPSAQYDAEGNSGVINLKMRKSRKKGLNGNVTLTGTKSIYEGTHNTVLINYNKGKTNWYTSLNYIHGRNTVFWQQDTRFLDDAGNTIARSFMQSLPVEEFDKYNVRLGADKNYSEKTTAGFGLTTAYYGNVMNSPITSFTQLQNGSILTSTRHTREHSLRRNATANVYLQHAFSKNSDINMNLDYLLNTKRLDQALETKTDSNAIALQNQLELNGRVPTNISVYSAKADHSTIFGNGLKLESGAKHSYVAVDNAAYFMQYTGGNWIDDISRSNRFLYSEHISALYVNGVKKLSDQWDAQLGLRGELANIEGLQEATGDHFSRHLPALFPTAYISYKPDSSNVLELNYGRRIQRPQYGMLNPFNYYTFYNSYQRGNPSLLPQYSHNAELKHSYKNKLISRLSASVTNNAITYVVLPDSASQTVYGIPVNFSSYRNASLGVTYLGKPAPWCELMVNTTGLYALYRGLLKNKPVQNEGVGYKVELNSRFLMEDWGIECYGSYTSGMSSSPVSTTLYGIYMNFGISRKGLLHDTTTIKLTIDDPFYVYRNGNNDVQPGLENTNKLYSNSRYCTMAVTYNFGRNAERRAARKEQPPEEARRM